jgi:hypothetical protein
MHEIDGKLNIADMLTKPLQMVKMQELLKGPLLKNAFRFEISTPESSQAGQNPTSFS